MHSDKTDADKLLSIGFRSAIELRQDGLLDSFMESLIEKIVLRLERENLPVTNRAITNMSAEYYMAMELALRNIDVFLLSVRIRQEIALRRSVKVLELDS